MNEKNNDFVSRIKKHSIEYGSVPFWSWNDRLKPEELRRQIRVMHDEQGMRGFFMHARGGLETEYMGDEWFECVDACIDEAQKLDMEAWAYDENGWPSGFAGGKVLEDKENLARYLAHKVTKEFDESAYAVYVLEDSILRHVTAPIQNQNSAKNCEYHCIYTESDPAYVDTMDADIVRKFIDNTHEVYKERLGGSFPKNMPGFFTDEPQYYRWQTPWSDKMPQEFKAKYGYDVEDGLAALFIDCEGAEKFRFDYYYLCHELFLNHFGKQLYDWHNDNNIELTGHYVEESFLGGQMWCCGGVMPFYEYEHIPGIDHLGPTTTNDIAPKQLGSVVAQLGKKFAISEMFGCAGWDISPLELKHIAEYQYAAGINRMCQHLNPYSLRGQRKREYPAFYSEHCSWYKSIKDLNEYFDRLGYILSMGKETVNTLVIHPIHSAYMTFKRNADTASVQELEDSFVDLCAKLSENQISYHFGDELLMRKYASVKDGKITVGECTYEYIVLPTLYSLDDSTANLLKQFIQQGGKLCIAGNAPTCINALQVDMSWLTPTAQLDDILSKGFVKTNSTEVRVMVRDTDDGRVFFLLNKSLKHLKNISVELSTTKEGCGDVAILDVNTLDFYSLPKDLCLDFEPGQSFVIVENQSGNCLPLTKQAQSVDIDNNFTFKTLPENILLLDRAQISYDGISFEQERPIEHVRDLLLRKRYKGDLYLKFVFEANAMPNNAKLVLEPVKGLQVLFNGQEVEACQTGELDFCNLSCDLTGKITGGTNEIVMKLDYFQDDYVYDILYGGFTEALRNCLNFNTEIENVYLMGNFEVGTDVTQYQNTFAEGYNPENPERAVACFDYEGKFTIQEQRQTIDFANFVQEGYPFFGGVFEVENSFEWDGDASKSELYMNGRFALAEVWLNDAFVGKIMFSNHISLAKFLKVGENKLVLKVYTSNRNLFGPHHWCQTEPHGVGPFNFSFENWWKEDGSCEPFRSRYGLIRSGFDCTSIN